MYSAETEFQGLLVTEEMLHFPKWRILNKDVSCSGKATNLTIFAWSGTNWHTNRKADTRQTNYRVGTRTRGHIPCTLHPKRRIIQPHLDSASQTHSYAQKNINFFFKLLPWLTDRHTKLPYKTQYKFRTLSHRRFSDLDNLTNINNRRVLSLVADVRQNTTSISTKAHAELQQTRHATSRNELRDNFLFHQGTCLDEETSMGFPACIRCCLTLGSAPTQ